VDPPKFGFARAYRRISKAAVAHDFWSAYILLCQVAPRAEMQKFSSRWILFCFDLLSISQPARAPASQRPPCLCYQLNSPPTPPLPRARPLSGARGAHEDPPHIAYPAAEAHCQSHSRIRPADEPPAAAAPKRGAAHFLRQQRRRRIPFGAGGVGFYPEIIRRPRWRRRRILPAGFPSGISRIPTRELIRAPAR
jgi:hypothetical protein